MSVTKVAAIINIAMWLGCSFAISVAIYYTHDMRCLFFFLIPALSGYTAKTTKVVEEDD